MNNKEKILKFIFEEPNKEFHLRLLARLSGLHPNTVISITDELSKCGLITKHKDKERNVAVIKANKQNDIYKLKKQFYNIEKIHESGLIDFLNRELSYPAVFLFGSYAKAENYPGSDIDLFIITEENKKINVNDYEAKLHAKMQLFIHTKAEFEKLKKTNPELINNVLNGYKLTGYLEVI